MNPRDARKKKKLDAFMSERDHHCTEDDASERFIRLTRRMALGNAAGKLKSKSAPMPLDLLPPDFASMR